MASEEAKKKPIIRCQKNGPYVVKDLTDLSKWEGEQLTP